MIVFSYKRWIERRVEDTGWITTVETTSANWRYLTSGVGNNVGKNVRLRFPNLLPRREPPELAVIAVGRHEQFWPNQQDFSVVEEDATIVLDALVNH